MYDVFVLYVQLMPLMRWILFENKTRSGSAASKELRTQSQSTI